MIRRLHRWIATGKPWVRRAIDALELLDWKTWVWGAVLGLDALTRQWLLWAKRKTFRPGVVTLTKDRKFRVVPKR